MVEFKAVIGTKDGKTHQVELKDSQADFLLKKRIGDKVSGNELGSLISPSCSEKATVENRKRMNRKIGSLIVVRFPPSSCDIRVFRLSEWGPPSKSPGKALSLVGYATLLGSTCYLAVSLGDGGACAPHLRTALASVAPYASFV